MYRLLSKLYLSKAVLQWHQDKERKEFVAMEVIIYIITTVQNMA